MLVFSLSKGVTAVCVHMLVERGLLDVDAPVDSYWPEFGAAGKEGIPLRWVLSHRCGVAAVDARVTMEDVVGWDGVVAAVAAQTPNWEPGTEHGYHARTWGWILGEVMRRVTRRSVRCFIAEELARPLGIELWLGLPEQLDEKAASVIPPEPLPPESQAVFEQMRSPDSLFERVLTGPGGLFAYDTRWNTRPFRAAEMPSSNVFATASAVARLFAATVGELDGVRLLHPDTVGAACVVQAEGPDHVLMLPTRFALGFALPPFLAADCPPSAFGHPGAGGSLGFADPNAGVGFGYVMNHMKLGFTPDARAGALVRALYSCL